MVTFMLLKRVLSYLQSEKNIKAKKMNKNLGMEILMNCPKILAVISYLTFGRIKQPKKEWALLFLVLARKKVNYHKINNKRRPFQMLSLNNCWKISLKLFRRSALVIGHARLYHLVALTTVVLSSLEEKETSYMF